MVESLCQYRCKVKDVRSDEVSAADVANYYQWRHCLRRSDRRRSDGSCRRLHPMDGGVQVVTKSICRRPTQLQRSRQRIRQTSDCFPDSQLRRVWLAPRRSWLREDSRLTDVSSYCTVSISLRWFTQLLLCWTQEKMVILPMESHANEHFHLYMFMRMDNDVRENY